MKIVTLIENSPCPTNAALKAEWGLSMHIVFNDRRILFDTGASGAFALNARRLGVDIADCDALVLSHHHYDHGGGLAAFLEANTTAPIYLGAAPDGDCFFRSFHFIQRSIGIDRELFRNYPDRFCFMEKPFEILPELFVYPRIVKRHPAPKGNRKLYIKKGSKFSSDDFSHEIVMAAKDRDGIVIFTGCSHSGVLNMLDTVAKHFGGVPIKAVIGGLHFVGMPPFNTLPDGIEEIQRVAQALLDYPVGITYTGHCTSLKAFRVMKEVMAESLQSILTGTVIDL